jgi:thermosome
MARSLPEILKEGTVRKRGYDVRSMNIAVAVRISGLLRTSLGPKGMKKLIFSQGGKFVITGDGAVILREVGAEHPAARIMMEAAKAQDSVAGDGTKTVVILAGELLERAERLLNLGVYPTVIISGFVKASKEAVKVLEDLAFDIKPYNKHVLNSIAKTALSSKIEGNEAQEHLARIVVEAIMRTMEEVDGKVKVDLENIKIEKREGCSLLDTFLVDGVVIDREITHPDMPKYVEDAKIALIKGALEVKEVKGKDLADVKLRITAPSQIRAFLDKETRIIHDMVEKVKASGANVALINRGMDDLAIYYLARSQISAWKRIFTPDMEKIARITGGKPVEVNELTSEALGYAKFVEEREIHGKRYLLIRGGKRHEASTIFVRGGTSYVIEEAERGIHDALCTVKSALEDGRVIVGGGASELNISTHLKRLAVRLSGREQLAVEAFAEAVKIIPKALAENSGLNVIDTLSTLEVEHSRGNRFTGVDVMKKEVRDMKDPGVFEPLGVKVHALKSAAELAIMILRIDDAFFAKRTKEEKPPKRPGPEEGWEWEEKPAGG